MPIAKQRIGLIIYLIAIILLLDLDSLSPGVQRATPLFVSAQRQRRQRSEGERDITASEVEEITDDKTIEDDPDELAKKAMMEEWDEHMSDFVPNDMLSVVLNPREEISLHEDAPEEPIYIRGAYFVNAGPGTEKDDRLIDFFVLDPNYQVIYSRRRHEEGIFRFNTTMQGQYSFVFSNMKDKQNTKQVTLALHPGKEEEEDVKEKDLKDNEKENREMAEAAGVEVEEIRELNSVIRKVYKSVKNLMTECKMSMIRQDSHNKAVDYNSKQNMYMTLFEAVCFMGICAFNLYHIKGILENRRII